MSRVRRTLRILRGRPATGETARFVDLDVDVPAEATVLDALESARIHIAPDLAYRHSCHHSSCGTCAAKIGGEERLTCVTKLADLPEDPVVLEPLDGFQVIADLAVDPAPLLRSIPPEWSYHRPDEAAAEGAGIGKTDPAERFEDCIECGACVSACPVTTEDPDFLGPAALAALNRQLEKGADEAPLLALAATPNAEPMCDRHIACSRRCPTGVAPAKHIFLLRRQRESK